LRGREVSLFSDNGVCVFFGKKATCPFLLRPRKMTSLSDTTLALGSETNVVHRHTTAPRRQHASEWLSRAWVSRPHPKIQKFCFANSPASEDDIVILDADLGVAKNALPPTPPLATTGARVATPARDMVAPRPAPATERLAIDMVREEAMVSYGVRRNGVKESEESHNQNPPLSTSQLFYVEVFRFFP
jgi:hypothetical protein